MGACSGTAAFILAGLSTRPGAPFTVTKHNHCLIEVQTTATPPCCSFYDSSLNFLSCFCWTDAGGVQKRFGWAQATMTTGWTIKIAY